MVNDVSASALVCFTDGSCLPNPGPCGAGAVIYYQDGQEECIKRPVTAYGSILLGELVAILSVTRDGVLVLILVLVLTRVLFFQYLAVLCT